MKALLIFFVCIIEVLSITPNDLFPRTVLTSNYNCTDNYNSAVTAKPVQIGLDYEEVLCPPSIGAFPLIDNNPSDKDVMDYFTFNLPTSSSLPDHDEFVLLIELEYNISIAEIHLFLYSSNDLQKYVAFSNRDFAGSSDVQAIVKRFPVSELNGQEMIIRTALYSWGTEESIPYTLKLKTANCFRDSLEPNNNESSAYNLNSVASFDSTSSTWTYNIPSPLGMCKNDTDWFSVTFGSTGLFQATVIFDDPAVTFPNQAYLRNSDGILVGTSFPWVNPLNGQKGVRIEGNIVSFESKVFYLVIYSTTFGEINSLYSLTASFYQCLSDSLNNHTPETAEVISQFDGYLRDDLALCTLEPDWFTLTGIPPSTIARISIRFENPLGIRTATLTDSSGNVLVTKLARKYETVIVLEFATSPIAQSFTLLVQALEGAPTFYNLSLAQDQCEGNPKVRTALTDDEEFSSSLCAARDDTFQAQVLPQSTARIIVKYDASKGKIQLRIRNETSVIASSSTFPSGGTELLFIRTWPQSNELTIVVSQLFGDLQIPYTIIVNSFACADGNPQNLQSTSATTLAFGRHNLAACDDKSYWYSITPPRSGKLVVSTFFDSSIGHVNAEVYTNSLSVVGANLRCCTSPKATIVDVQANARYLIRTYITPGYNVPYQLQVNLAECVADRFENNNNFEQAALIDTSYSGLVACQGDDDWFRLVVPRDLAGFLEVKGEYVPDEGEIDIQLMDTSMNQLEVPRFVTTQGGVSAKRIFIATIPQSYYIKISLKTQLPTQYAISLTINGVPLPDGALVPKNPTSFSHILKPSYMVSITLALMIVLCSIHY